MQIAFHIGANCTDEDRILKSLLKNAGSLSDVGIKVPGPGKYRRIIRETIQNLNGMPPAANTRGILLDAILDDADADRVVLSNTILRVLKDPKKLLMFERKWILVSV